MKVVLHRWGRSCRSPQTRCRSRPSEAAGPAEGRAADAFALVRESWSESWAATCRALPAHRRGPAGRRLVGQVHRARLRDGRDVVVRCSTGGRCGHRGRPGRAGPDRPRDQHGQAELRCAQPDRRAARAHRRGARLPLRGAQPGAVSPAVGGAPAHPGAARPSRAHHPARADPGLRARVRLLRLRPLGQRAREAGGVGRHRRLRVRLDVLPPRLQRGSASGQLPVPRGRRRHLHRLRLREAFGVEPMAGQALLPGHPGEDGPLDELIVPLGLVLPGAVGPRADLGPLALSPGSYWSGDLSSPRSTWRAAATP